VRPAVACASVNFVKVVHRYPQSARASTDVVRVEEVVHLDCSSELSAKMIF